MFTKLKQHWKVNGLDLILIIITFAVGGSLCGIAGRKIMTLLNIEKGALWILLYIFLVTLLWPMAVLLVSIPLGQFVFFKNYIGKIVGRFLNKKNHPKINVAIFASGAGSNAHKIINYFAGNHKIKIALIICNKPGAGVLNIAARGKDAGDDDGGIGDPERPAHPDIQRGVGDNERIVHSHVT